MTEAQIARSGWPLWKIGLTASVLSAIANLALMLVTKPLLSVAQTFGPLTAGPIVAWSFIGTFGAVGVYALIKKWSASPKRVFNIVAVIVLLLSFIPDVAVVNVAEGPMAGGTMAAAFVLMGMHVISFLIVVPMLHRLAR